MPDAVEEEEEEEEDALRVERALLICNGIKDVNWIERDLFRLYIFGVKECRMEREKSLRL